MSNYSFKYFSNVPATDDQNQNLAGLLTLGKEADKGPSMLQ